MDIALATNPAAFTLTQDQIAVYPTTKRALASVVAPHLSGQQIDYTEMLLQDLDHLKGTTGGLIDLPGAAQALTFQGVPGKPRCFAQLRVYDFELHPVDPNPVKTVFQVLNSLGTAVVGHWPETFSLVQPSAGLSPTAAAAILTPQWPQLQPQGTFAPQPWVPTPADLATFQNSITAAMSATATAATAAGTPIDPKMLRITDRRALAKPIKLGPSINGSGTDSGGYWIDTTDPDQMAQLLVNTAGAVVDLPDPAHLYAIPGPRWYRPWSPQIVLQNAGRSYRFGEDGRFDSTNGNLHCRTSGYTVYGIVANIGTPVLASAVLANAKAITSNASLPVETSALLGEAVLLDTGSVAVLAAAAVSPTQTTTVADYFAQAVRGLYLVPERKVLLPLQNNVL